MESYEEFCLRTLALLQEEGTFRKKWACDPACSPKARSVIHFHGRAVLSVAHSYLLVHMSSLLIFLHRCMRC
uniref:Uncharacterized protein n=1 Tax=Stegastes partitus TaxID=144197 RepID=A0A3B5A0X1_9TELE